MPFPPPSPAQTRSPFPATFLPPTPSRNRYASAEPSSPIRPTSSYSTASIRRVTPSPEIEITDDMKEKARGFAREREIGVLNAYPCRMGGGVGAGEGVGEPAGEGPGLIMRAEEMARPGAPTPNAAAPPAARYSLRPQSSGSWLGHSRSRHQLYSTENASTATLNNKESFKNLLATGSATGDAAAAAPALLAVANGSGKEYLPNRKSTQRLDYSEDLGVKYRLSVNVGLKRITRAGHGNGGGGYAEYGGAEYERPETPTPVSERERRMMFRPLYIRGRARAEIGELTAKQRVAERRGEEGGGQGLCKGEEFGDSRSAGGQLRELDGNEDLETSGNTYINPDVNSSTIADQESNHRGGGELETRNLDFTNVTRRAGRRTNRQKQLTEPVACVCGNEGNGETKRGDKEIDEGEEKKGDEKELGGEAVHNGRATRSEQEEEVEQRHGNGTGNRESKRSGTAKKQQKNGGVKAKKGKNKRQASKRSWNLEGVNSARPHRKSRYDYRTEMHENGGKRGSWGEQEQQQQQGGEGNRERGCRVRCNVM